MKNDFTNPNPSEVTDVYWLYAERIKGEYPQHTDNGGKWLIFVDLEDFDRAWQIIKTATENGLLGESSKVATARDNPNATDKTKKVICVYTYDYTDRADVMRIREVLRGLGIKNKIPYKTDSATDKGQYRGKGYKRISVIMSDQYIHSSILLLSLYPHFLSQIRRLKSRSLS